MHTDCPCQCEDCLPVWFHSRSICDTMPICCSVSDDNCSQKAATDETSMGCHRVSVIFQIKKTRSSKLLNVKQIPQYTMKLLHKPALFHLQPEDQSRHYPGRHRPQGFKPTCSLVFQQSLRKGAEKFMNSVLQISQPLGHCRSLCLWLHWKMH